jgi:hypothetical protein
MVARNQSGFCSGPQAMRLPSLRSSSMCRTWSPKVPAPWWFLPCTSLAIAPPTVASCVPGVTGSIQPRGIASRWISRSSTPASQTRLPLSASNSMKRSSPRVSHRAPPGLRQTSP